MSEDLVPNVLFHEVLVVGSSGGGDELESKQLDDVSHVVLRCSQVSLFLYAPIFLQGCAETVVVSDRGTA
jgi:hypothetical protein